MDLVMCALGHAKLYDRAEDESRWRVTLPEGLILIGPIELLNGDYYLVRDGDRIIYFQASKVIMMERQ